MRYAQAKEISLTGIHTKRELVNLALKELVQNRKRKDLFKLAGQLEFRDDFEKPTQKTSACFKPSNNGAVNWMRTVR